MKRFRTCAVAAGTLAGCWLAAPAHAVEIYWNFENGTVLPWLSGSSGGTGTIGVVQHNNSAMAHIDQSTGGWHSLSLDFDYVRSDVMSFDMQAYSQGYRGGAGVSISFNNALNVSLGSVEFYNLTDPSTLGPHGFPVDTSQHHYDTAVGTLASVAGLASTSPISKVSVTFIAWSSGYTGSFGEVWFDNFRVTAVPEPAPGALLAAGLAALALASRQRWRAAGARDPAQDR